VVKQIIFGEGAIPMFTRDSSVFLTSQPKFISRFRRSGSSAFGNHRNPLGAGKNGLENAFEPSNLQYMSTVTIHLDDDVARLVAEAAQMARQPLESWLRDSVCQAAARAVSSTKAGVRRIAPLHPGAMQPAADFNAPLEEFAPYV
jgi:hypothetical protein